MSIRSLGYLFLAGGVGFLVFVSVWGVLNEPVSEIQDRPTWNNQTDRYGNTSADEYAARGQRMVGQAWQWAPGVGMLAIGFTILLGARDRGAG